MGPHLQLYGYDVRSSAVVLLSKLSSKLSQLCEENTSTMCARLQAVAFSLPLRRTCSCCHRLFLVSRLVDENGDFQTIFNASVPITCCKLDKKNTNYPKKVEDKDVTQGLTTADEEYTNHEVLHDCTIYRLYVLPRLLRCDF